MVAISVVRTTATDGRCAGRPVLGPIEVFDQPPARDVGIARRRADAPDGRGGRRGVAGTDRDPAVSGRSRGGPPPLVRCVRGSAEGSAGAPLRRRGPRTARAACRGSAGTTPAAVRARSTASRTGNTPGSSDQPSGAFSHGARAAVVGHHRTAAWPRPHAAVTLTGSKPLRARYCDTRSERPPAWQTTNSRASGSISSIRAGTSPIGMCWAPGHGRAATRRPLVRRAAPPNRRMSLAHRPRSAVRFHVVHASHAGTPSTRPHQPAHLQTATAIRGYPQFPQVHPQASWRATPRLSRSICEISGSCCG